MELALIAPVLAVLVFGVLDLSRAYRLQIQLEAAAGAGARFAEVFPNDVDCPGDDDILGRVLDEEPGLDGRPGFSFAVFTDDGSGNLTAPVTGCGGTAVGAGEPVLIEIEADFEILTPLVANIVGDQLTIRGTARTEALG